MFLSFSIPSSLSESSEKMTSGEDRKMHKFSNLQNFYWVPTACTRNAMIGKMNYICTFAGLIGRVNRKQSE